MQALNLIAGEEEAPRLLVERRHPPATPRGSAMLCVLSVSVKSLPRHGFPETQRRERFYGEEKAGTTKRDRAISLANERGRTRNFYN